MWTVHTCTQTHLGTPMRYFSRQYSSICSHGAESANESSLDNDNTVTYKKF